MLKTASRPLALTAGSALVLAGLVAGPMAASVASAAPAAADVRITEWEYGDSEFVEFTNLGTVSADLAGWSFSDSGAVAGQVQLGSVGTVAPGESFLLTDASDAGFRAEWKLPSTIKVVSGNTVGLGRADAINLYDSSNTLVDSLSYDDESAKGPRTKSVSARPSSEAAIGANNAADWTLSTVDDAEGSWTSTKGSIGSPGVSRFGAPVGLLRINEIETDGKPNDWVELINLAPRALDISGYSLTGRENSVTSTIASGTVIAAGGVYTVENSTLKLKKSDKLSLVSPDGTTLLDSYEWGAFHLDTYGRLPNGTGDFVKQAAPSKGALNPETTTPTDPVDPGTGWQSITINEVTSANDAPYRDAYELANSGDTDVDVAAWKQADSTSNPAALNAPNGTVVPAHGYLVLLSNQGLSSDGDSVKLYLPDGTTVADTASWGANDAEPGSWSRCVDATGTWAHTASSSWGVSNATACAGTIIPPSTQVPDAPCQSEKASGSGAALAGGLAWPGGQAAVAADSQCQFVTSLSGQDVSGLDIDPSAPGVMWAVKNKSHVYRLLKTETGLWVPDTTNGWTSGKNLVFPSGSGQPDAEGITVGPDGFLYITTERDNSASSVALDSVLRFDPSETGTTLHPTTQWILTADLSAVISTGVKADANLGFEGITWVPDSYLTANGFVDQRTGATYDPADYPGHGAGLYFTALEKNGHLYAYALNADGSFTRIASIDTGLPLIADTQWDPDAQRIWAVADNSVSGSSTLLKIDSAGAFAVDRIYDRPTGLPNYNNEGFALAPNSTCSDGVKEVIRSDDGNNGGHSLWSGTIACDLVLGPQGVTPPASAGPTVAVNLSTVKAGDPITVTAAGLTPGTVYSVVLHSDPVTLGSAAAGSSGTLTITAVVPAGTTPGAHTIEIVSAAHPSVALASTPLTVTAGTSVAAPTGTTPSALASTGAEPAPWLAIGSLIVLLGGGLVLLRVRMRRGDA